MKPRKTTLLIALIALILAAFAVGMAQGPTQTDQKKKAESCCAEGAKCCAEGSCKEHENKEGENKDGAKKEHADCCGDSCELDDARSGDTAKAKHKHGEGGECCKAKQKEKSKPKTKA